MKKPHSGGIPTGYCRITRSITGAGLFFVFLAGLSGIAQAATVGRWRFENAGNLGLDSGSNGLDLTNQNSTASSTTVASNPIPQANSTNTRAGDFELSSSNYLSVSDHSAFAVQSFTIEAYIRLESGGTGSTARIIASQLNTGTGVSAGWQFGITGSGSGLGATRPFLQLSSDGLNLYGFSPEPLVSGSNFVITTSPLTPDYYYLAATVDFSGGAIATKFYLQNITQGGSLISLDGTVSYPSGITTLPTTLHNSTANFAIGASYNNGSATRFFDGLIDEVRLSDTALSTNQLLAVPEPASMLLVGLGVLSIGAVRRRHI